MMRRIRPHASSLIAAGLFGMALYTVGVRAGIPTALGGDFVHGAWVGVCVGLEVVGVVILRKPKPGITA